MEIVGTIFWVLGITFMFLSAAAVTFSDKILAMLFSIFFLGTAVIIYLRHLINII